MYLYLYMRVYPQVDFSVDNDLAVYKSRLLNEYTKFDERYPALVRSPSLTFSPSLSRARARALSLSLSLSH